MNPHPNSITINEHDTEPLSDYAINYLTNQKKECAYTDFKLIADVSKGSDFPEIAKDIFAFSNYGGGWILIGWKEYKKNRFVPVGLPQDYELESAVLQEKFNSFAEYPITLEYKEFERDFTHLFSKADEEVKKQVHSVSKRFGAIFIPPSKQVLLPKKEGSYLKGQTLRVVFKEKDILYRRGTQSIIASKIEEDLIKKRAEKEEHRISILSGEPDDVDEELLSNVFKVIKIPKYIYLGDKKPYDDASIKSLLNERGVKNAFFYKFKEWNKKIVTFENLQDENNPYSSLIEKNSSTREIVDSWLEDEDKRKRIVELLNKELTHYALSKDIHYDFDKGKFFYPVNKNEGETRKFDWAGRYKQSHKVVATKMYASQLGKYIFWHISFSASFFMMGREIYLKITPTFVITEDGFRVLSGSREGTVITRLSYSMHNSKYLNNILFWIGQLADNGNINLKGYIEISAEPVKANLSKGIMFDLPSSEFEDEEEIETLETEEEDEI